MKKELLPMQYIRQAIYIFGFSFLGEVLNRLIPLPIPASIYGMVLLFLALQLKLISIDQVKDMGGFLTGILSVLFVPPIVALVDYWDLLRANLLPILAIFTVSSLLTFALAGRLTQAMIRRKEDKAND